MQNDSNSNYVVAGVHRTAVAFSALIICTSFAFAADPPVTRGNVSVNVSPTTGYYVTNNNTFRLPNGVSATTSAGIPVVSRYPGGLQQTLPTGITITGVKNSAPLPAVVRASTQSLKNAAKGLLRSPKINPALLLGGLGLQALLNGVGGIIENGQLLVRSNSGLSSMPPALEYTYGQLPGTAVNSCPSDTVSVYSYSAGLDKIHRCCNTSFQSNNLVGYDDSGGLGTCQYGLGPPADPNWMYGPALPPSPDDLDSLISSYTPDPTDWIALVPSITLDDVQITSAPTLQGDPKTTTIYDANGNPVKVTQTNIWHNFDIRDNPSSSPALDLKTTEETKTFENGVLTGTSTSETTSLGGSGGAPAPEIEIPTDCDFMPTVCAFIDWFKQEPDEPDDDLSGLLQEAPVVNETFTITGGAAACPAPLVLDLSRFGSREVSYQPLCDLAGTMKYLYLALMSFAAAVLLNRSINRV